MVWKKVVNSDPGDTDHFGGDDVDKISDLLSGVDVDDVVINADFAFKSGKLQRQNPAGTFTLTEINPAISSNKEKRAYQPYNYLVMAEGATTYAVNGLTGAVDSASATPTTVLQYAMDNLSAARTQKEVVKVVGSFSVTSLTIPSYTVLDLSAAKLTQTASTNLNMLINNDTSGGNIQIEIFGGKLDGNKLNQSVDGTNYDTRNIINFTKVQDSSIHDTYNVDSNSSCIFLGECHNVAVHRNSLVTPRKCGVRLDATSTSTPGSYVFVTNNYMYNQPENFVASCTSSDLFIQANLCDVNGTNGLNLNGPNNHVINNTIKTCDRGGISMGGEASPFGAGDYSEIIGNLVWECMENGIVTGVTQGGDYVTIANNKVKGHPTTQSVAAGKSFGIRMRGNYGIIKGNQVWGWNRTGISITGINSTATFDSRSMGSSRIIVEGNISHTNGQLGATETTNYLKGGIVVYGTGTETAYNNNIIIRGNTCYNNIDYGILFRNSTGTIIEDNDLTGNVTGALLNVASNV